MLCGYTQPGGATTWDQVRMTVELLGSDERTALYVGDFSVERWFFNFDINSFSNASFCIQNMTIAVFKLVAPCLSCLFCVWNVQGHCFCWRTAWAFETLPQHMECCSVCYVLHWQLWKCFSLIFFWIYQRHSLDNHTLNGIKMWNEYCLATTKLICVRIMSPEQICMSHNNNLSAQNSAISYRENV